MKTKWDKRRERTRPSGKMEERENKIKKRTRKRRI
jgi:hypothetical protein